MSVLAAGLFAERIWKRSVVLAGFVAHQVNVM